MQYPTFVQGVFLFNLFALAGALTVLFLLIASSNVGTILLIPHMIITFSGPYNKAATLFPFPSTLYSCPSSVMALLLEKYASAKKASLY